MLGSLPSTSSQYWSHPVDSQPETVSDAVRPYSFVYGSTCLTLRPEFVFNPEVFFSVINPAVWQLVGVLDKKRLKALLPSRLSDEDKEQVVVDILGARKNFFFGNPLVQFYQKLRSGYYEREMQPKLLALRQCCKLQYECWIRNHYANLLKTLLLRRKHLLAQALEGTAPQSRRANRAVANNESVQQTLRRRALTRARLMIMSCKAKVNESNFSSDDEDIAETVKYGTSGFSKAHDDISSMSTLGRLDTADLDLFKPIYGNNFKRMLSEYRMLRKMHKDHPTLDFADVTLEGIVERSGLQHYFAKMVDRASSLEPAANPLEQADGGDVSVRVSPSAVPATQSVDSMTNLNFSTHHHS